MINFWVKLLYPSSQRKMSESIFNEQTESSGKLGIFTPWEEHVLWLLFHQENFRLGSGWRQTRKIKFGAFQSNAINLGITNFGSFCYTFLCDFLKKNSIFLEEKFSLNMKWFWGQWDIVVDTVFHIWSTKLAEFVV